jgi:hypothetical protein
MSHYLDRFVASDLSYLVQQRIQREQQLGQPMGDSQHCRMQLVTGYNPRLFVADPDMGQPDNGDRARPKGRERLDMGKG